MMRTRSTATSVHYSSRELSYIRMHQLKKIEKRRRFIEEVKLFFGMMLLCSLFIFGLDGARTLYQRALEDRQETVEIGAVTFPNASPDHFYASSGTYDNAGKRLVVTFPALS